MQNKRLLHCDISSSISIKIIAEKNSSNWFDSERQRQKFGLLCYEYEHFNNARQIRSRNWCAECSESLFRTSSLIHFITHFLLSNNRKNKSLTHIHTYLNSVIILKRTEQIHGWEEAWNFLPGSYFGNVSTLFHPSIPECDGARWILLNYTKSDQRGVFLILDILHKLKQQKLFISLFEAL